MPKDMDRTKTTALVRKVAAALDESHIPEEEIAEIIRLVTEAEEASNEELRRATAGEGLEELRNRRLGIHGDERDWRPPGGNWIDEW